MFAFFPKAQHLKAMKIDVFDYSTVIWCPSPGNPRKYPHKTYIARNQSHWATSSLAIVRVYFQFSL